jgi:hypothetical protein
MTELQILIRDSNGMPPLIRADYLQDAGFDLEADWTRRGEFRRNPRMVTGYADGRGLYIPHSLHDIGVCLCGGQACGAYLQEGEAWNKIGWGCRDVGYAPGVDGFDRRLPNFAEGN